MNNLGLNNILKYILVATFTTTFLAWVIPLIVLFSQNKALGLFMFNTWSLLYTCSIITLVINPIILIISLVKSFIEKDRNQKNKWYHLAFFALVIVIFVIPYFIFSFAFKSGYRG